MNNIFLPNDPLLYNQQHTDYKQLYEQKLMKERELLDRQYNEYMQKSSVKHADKVAELNQCIKDLPPEIKDILQDNGEFVALNTQLQESVQAELLELVKGNINMNPAMVSNIDRQIAIINDISNKAKEQDRQNMSQINDYLKNYSSMTFDEYKKLKNL